MFCDWGWHRAEADAVWNGRIGFSRCRHCRADLVRRPGARWTGVPHGYAVVWRPADQAPDPAEVAALARSEAPRPPASRAYRYLARRIGRTPARSIVLSALCEAAAANEALLLLAAMLRDELGGRLLIIDATLDDGGIGTLLGARGRSGLSEVHRADPADFIVPLADSRLFLLSGGRKPRVTTGEILADLLPRLAERFDHILIQQRAITADTRNLALAGAADRVLVLAQEGVTPMADLTRARDGFRANGIDVAGVVLTVAAGRGDAG